MPLHPTRPVTRKDLSTQACDFCRKHKVKCKFPPHLAPEASRCGRCERLDLPCTLLAPSKPRGPKKRAQAERMAGVTTESPQPPDKYLSDDICDRSLLHVIMEDYLMNLYPLIPIVHRPSFRRALQTGRDSEDRGFLALIIGIAAVVVATMPSKFQAYQSHRPALRFATRKEMVWYCYDKVIRLRTSTYFDHINFQKFAVSYLFFAAFLQLGDHNWSRMLSVEAMQLARILSLHRISEYDGLNCIETQLRKKGFWLTFYGFVHAHLQNMFRERLSYLDPVLLQTINPDELMPLEVDDEFIFEDHVLIPTNPPPSLVSGFILHSRIFWAAIRDPKPSKSIEEPCSCVRTRDTEMQIAYLQDRLHSLKYLQRSAPPLLQPWRLTNEEDQGICSDTQILQSNFASMRANLYVTHLWVQSLLLDRLEGAQSHQNGLVMSSSHSQPTAMQQALWLEREELCRQLFFVLHAIPQPNLEANGLHLAYKVREMVSGLLPCPFHPDEPEAKHAARYIQHSTDILSRLDKSESMNGIHIQSWVDTDRAPAA